MKKIIAVIVVILTSQALLAGCGGCSPKKSKGQTYNSSGMILLENVPDNNIVSGNVLVSCGMCNFFTYDNDCSMAVKIGKNVYEVEGAKIDDHGDSHARDGYCNVIKKVYVEGKISGNSFVPTRMDVAKL